MRAKDREKNLTECFYFEMDLECFVVCNNRVLFIFIILQHMQKQTECFYLEMSNNLSQGRRGWFLKLPRMHKGRKAFDLIGACESNVFP